MKKRAVFVQLKRPSVAFMAPFLSLSVFLILSCGHKKSYQQDQGAVFGTFYNITYQADSSIGNEIESVFDQINQSLSVFEDSSVVSKVNRNEFVVLDASFRQVFNRSMEISAQTAGAFDVTVNPLIDLWGFGSNENSTLDTLLIDSILHFVGYQNVIIEDDAVVKKNRNLTLNFSAIAKGFACDKVAELFNARRIDNYLIEIGGEMVLKGVNENGNRWNIAIEAPQKEQSNAIQTPYRVFQMTNKAVATSGNYYSYQQVGLQKVGHTINPLTGYSIENKLLSATIIANDCMTADAFATACMVLGVENSMQLLKKHSELAGFFIYQTALGELTDCWVNGADFALSNEK